MTPFNLCPNHVNLTQQIMSESSYKVHIKRFNLCLEGGEQNEIVHGGETVCLLVSTLTFACCAHPVTENWLLAQ